MSEAVAGFAEGQEVEAFYFGRWRPGRIVRVHATGQVTAEVFLPHGVRTRRTVRLKLARIRKPGGNGA